jgi:tRNA pseudouridine55 synthase
LTTLQPPQMDGLLLVDKPADITSHDVVHRVRKIIKQKSVGHTGTLDPLATGLMILVLGEATKLSDYLLSADKSYWIKIRLGVTSDTLDRTGVVLTETPCTVTREEVEAAVVKLQGDFEWPVPLYSAAKIDGKKLYEYGRSGQDIELPKKIMSFWDAQVEEFGGNMLQLKISCSKGSFVRTWASQLGALLGVGGWIEELRRVSSGPFSIDQTLTLETLDQKGLAGSGFEPAFVPMAQALPAWKSLIANPKDARLVANGQVPRDMINRLVFEQKQAFASSSPVYVKVITGGGDLLAILAAEPGQGLKIRRVFRTFT